MIEINEDKDNIHDYIEIEDDIKNNKKLIKEKILKNYKKTHTRMNQHIY